ncbi:MAG TPA: M24 family metallopeptidase [Burkholderiales bacterium]|nr:M24 family metallopeptidase [Burkholderiales bacterium]
MDPKADIFPRFSDEEYARRYAAVRREMAARGLDALIVVGDSGGRTANQANVYWLTNWLDPMVAYVIMTPTAGPWLLMSNPLYLHTALRAGHAEDIRAGTGINPGPELAAWLSDAGLSSGRIGIAGVRNVGRASVPSEHRDALEQALPQAQFVDALEVLMRPRMIKSAEEIAWFERGAEWTDRVIERMASGLRIGMPEYQISALIHEVVLPLGGTVRLQFVGATPMAAPEIIFPWQYPSNRPLQRGDVLLTEISASYGNCSGQIQRPFAIGAEPTPEYQRLYDLASEAYHRIFEVLKPGATDADVRGAASFIEHAGYQTLDVLLHGWGVQIEPPRVDLPSAMIKRELAPVTFRENMLIVVQPHVVTADGKRGLQAGGLVVIEKNGARALQKYPMEFIRVA